VAMGVATGSFDSAGRQVSTTAIWQYRQAGKNDYTDKTRQNPNPSPQHWVSVFSISHTKTYKRTGYPNKGGYHLTTGALPFQTKGTRSQLAIMSASKDVNLQHCMKLRKATLSSAAGAIFSIIGFTTQQSLLAPARAYPAVEMQACMKEAIQSTAAKGLDYTGRQLQNYCHCALTLVIDEGQGTTSSVRYCNKKYL